MVEYLQDHTTLSTSDTDEARQAVAAKFCDHCLHVEHGRLNMRHSHLATTHTSFNYLRYGARTNINPGSLGSFFLLQIPIHGAARVRHRGQDIDSDRNTATVLNPDRDTTMEWGETCEKILVQFDQDFVTDVACDLVGAPLPGPIRFAPLVDLMIPQGRKLRNVSLSCIQAIDNKKLFVGQDLNSLKAERDLVATLLLNQPSNITHLLNAAKPGTTRHLRQAIAYIHANLQEAISISDLAAAAGLGVRSLQLTFRHNLGRSPMTVLRDTRLDIAHYHLQRHCDPQGVSETAFFCGYSHLGRFSRDYKLRFGLSPSQTRQHH